MLRQKWVGLGVAICLPLAAMPAAAQDNSNFARSAAAALELVGEGVGDAARGGPSILVTATGTARLPAPLVEKFNLSIEGVAGSAVDATRLRDQKLALVKEAAARRQISVEYGQSTIAPEVDQAAVNARHKKNSAPGAFDTSPPIDSEVRFAARTTLKLSAPGSGDLAPFLDELHKAGVGFVSAGGAVNGMAGIFNAGQVLGFGQVAQVDPAIWDEATRAALAEAKREAEVIAVASGRPLGSVRQVTVFSRNASGAEATVTLSVRFDFRAP